jgi:hypothetical protein
MVVLWPCPSSPARSAALEYVHVTYKLVRKVVYARGHAQVLWI